LRQPASRNAAATGTTTEKTANVATAACTARRWGNDACAIANASPLAWIPVIRATTMRSPRGERTAVQPAAIAVMTVTAATRCDAVGDGVDHVMPVSDQDHHDD
jgi:hypothetical protein